MSDIQIFVCNTPGKDSQQVAQSIYHPIYGGAALTQQTMNPEFARDDAGENISDKNRSYCEMTVQYWAWKNVQADYYGFCHYRRYFGFSASRAQEDVYGNVIAEYISEKNIAKYGLDEAAARKVIEGADIVVTDRVDVTKMPEFYTSIRDHYRKGCSLHEKDLDLLLQLMDEQCPEYSETARRYLDGPSGYYCNMFVMRKELFQEYAQWLFDLLQEFDKRADMSHYSVEGYRTPGHLAERLTGIFIDYKRKTCPELVVREVPCVLFRKPERNIPLSKPNKAGLVPVVFAANNGFVGPLSVAIKSLLLHASPERFYDIVVLESDITAQNKSMLSGMVAQYPNAQLRYFNAVSKLEGYTLTAHAHISVETFYRFLIQSVMPDYDKVLYLDGDIVIQGDVAELYDTDVRGKMLGAVLDVDFASQINGFAPGMMKYAVKTLKLEDPYRYFQAGVLLLNLTEMRKAHTQEEWLELASVDYKYSDQDVLNVCCQNQVVYLPQEWNLLFDNDFTRVSEVFRFAPREHRLQYDAAAKNPKIIHYAGFVKPWNRVPADRYSEFWSVARQTPFYEVMLYEMVMRLGRDMAFDTNRNHLHEYHLFSLRNGKNKAKSLVKKIARKIVNLFAPKGTRRRENLKKRLGIVKDDFPLYQWEEQYR